MSDARSSSPLLDRRHMLGLTLGATAVGAAATSAVAASPAKTARGAKTASAMPAVDALADALIAERIVPGLSLAVMRGGSLLHARGFGSANLETDAPVTPETVFRVGSVSKQFIATAIALLQEDGKLDFDDRLSRFLPLFPRSRDVTLRQMITHTSGLGNYTATAAPDSGAARTDYGDPQLLAEMASSTVPLFTSEPGTAWAYSNTAYVLLGLVVQVVADEPYSAFLKRRLIDRAGLLQTAVDDAGDVVRHRASGYSLDPARPGEVRNAPFISMTFPGAAGAMRSTATDLCRWHAALLGGRIVKPETLKVMLTPARLKNGALPDAPSPPGAAPDAPKKPMKYGFGLFFGDFEGRDYIEHGGGINGFISRFRSFWPQEITVAALVNTDALDTPAKAERVAAVQDAAARAALARV